MDSITQWILLMNIVGIHVSTLWKRRTNESKRVLEEFLSDIRRLGWRVTRLRSDLGSEYVNNNSQSDTKATFESTLSEFEKICDREDIKFTQAPKGVSKLNGIVERYNRTLSELANAFLYHGRVSPILGIRVQTLQLDLQPFDTYRTWDIRPMRTFTIWQTADIILRHVWMASE